MHFVCDASTMHLHRAKHMIAVAFGGGQKGGGSDPGKYFLWNNGLYEK